MHMCYNLRSFSGAHMGASKRFSSRKFCRQNPNLSLSLGLDRIVLLAIVTAGVVTSLAAPHGSLPRITVDGNNTR